MSRHLAADERNLFEQAVAHELMVLMKDQAWFRLPLSEHCKPLVQPASLSTALPGRRRGQFSLSATDGIKAAVHDCTRAQTLGCKNILQAQSMSTCPSYLDRFSRTDYSICLLRRFSESQKKSNL